MNYANIEQFACVYANEDVGERKFPLLLNLIKAPVKEKYKKIFKQKYFIK